jgi:hypothetical protein
MSEVKVNKISPRTNCGTTQLGDAGDTITVTGDLKSNSVKPATGTTLTLGTSGDTVTLASGASQSGFGRSGSVDWQTGSIKTGTFTAASGEGYFADTSSSAFTMNLPAGTAGAIVAVADYTRTFNSNNLTISPNGSQKIGGIAQDLILDVNGQALTLIYVDDTEGWINVQNAEDTETGIPQFITATGGSITESGDFRIHTFTGPGTFAISHIAPSPSGNPNAMDYNVVAGGGGKSGGGSNGSDGGSPGGPGGAGLAISITGASVAYAGGGGGGKDNRSSGGNGGTGGTGGGGDGGAGASGNPPVPGSAGTANTGGGGGGAGQGPFYEPFDGFNGGSGVVIIRYKYQ